LNSRLKASDEEPVRLYYGDFDDNGKSEQIVTYHVNGKELPFANKDELQKQIPEIKKDFLYAGDFAKASIDEMFKKNKLKNAQLLTANYFSNAVLINDGRLHFTTKSLPWEAQLTSYRDAVVVNANDDDLPDILLVGNYYDNNIQMGRYDADFGTVLVNKDMEVHVKQTPQIKTVRHIRKINLAGNGAAFAEGTTICHGDPAEALNASSVKAFPESVSHARMEIVVFHFVVSIVPVCL
jgi:hypothetical protein